MGPGTRPDRLAACFAIGASTGLEIATLLRIDGLGYLPATDAKGVIPANWRITPTSPAPPRPPSMPVRRR